MCDLGPKCHGCSNGGRRVQSRHRFVDDGASGSCTNSNGANWDGTNKLMLRRASGSTAPSSPTSGTLVADLTPNTTSRTDFVHRSDKSFAYALFACEDSGCASWYADGSGSQEAGTDSTATTATDPEEWILTDVSGESDVSSAAIDISGTNAPHIFFYPSDWGSSLSNKLAMYYSKGADGGSASEVFYVIHDDTGWPSTNPLNASASWSSPVLVAEGSTDSADDDYRADHPWAMLTRNGASKRIQLFVQSQDLANNQVIQIESSDEVGDDFGLTCGASSCSTTILDGGGYVAVDADGTSSTDYVKHAQHSRIGWDYVADAYIDAGTDLPFMMFQVVRPSSGDCSDAGPYDDIGWADGAWNGGSSVWDWAVETTGSSPDCPVVHIENGHDNTMIPLPFGEFKLYYKSWTNDDWYVTYWNGSDWVDDALIEFYWDGSASGPSHECIENPAALVHNDGAGGINSAMAFMLMDSDTCGAVGFDDEDPGSDYVDSAIVFAEHSN